MKPPSIRKGAGSIPERVAHVRDVGASAELANGVPGLHRPIYFVGSDGSLWLTELATFGQVTQVPSPGDLTRVAVASNGGVWCVDTRDALWLMQDGVWSRIDVPGNTNHPRLLKHRTSRCRRCLLYTSDAADE